MIITDFLVLLDQWQSMIVGLQIRPIRVRDFLSDDVNRSGAQFSLGVDSLRFPPDDDAGDEDDDEEENEDDEDDVEDDDDKDDDDDAALDDNANGRVYMDDNDDDE